MPKVSVIIPVYNVEPYLRECLDSVVKQTLKDIEIICIEDCSTDDSLTILEEYADNDSRIVLLRNEVNSGLSVTRNRGIEIAKGEYIQFLDSDDFLSLDALEKMYQISVKHGLDLLKPQMRYNPPSAGKYFQYSDEMVGKVYSGPQLLYEFILRSDGDYGWGWLGFIKADLLRSHSIRFYPGIYYEDTAYSLEIYMHAQRSMCINEYVYIYRIRPGSILKSQLSSEHVRSYVVCLELLIKHFCSEKTDFQKALAMIAYYNERYDLRDRFFDKNAPFPDMAGWDQDTVDTYKALYKFARDWQLVSKHIDLLREEKVYVYGAGAIANRVMEALDIYDIAVEGVFVTDPDKWARKSLLGHSVRGLDEMLPDPEHDVVILAAAEKNQAEMLGNLHKKGVRNIIRWI